VLTDVMILASRTTVRRTGDEPTPGDQRRRPGARQPTRRPGQSREGQV